MSIDHLGKELLFDEQIAFALRQSESGTTGQTAADCESAAWDFQRARRRLAGFLIFNRTSQKRWALSGVTSPPRSSEPRLDQKQAASRLPRRSSRNR